MEASQTRAYCVAKNRDASRGSLRSFPTQKRVVQDDIKVWCMGGMGKRAKRALIASPRTATHRAARSDPSQRKKRIAQDDNGLGVKLLADWNLVSGQRRS